MSDFQSVSSFSSFFALQCFNKLFTKLFSYLMKVVMMLFKDIVRNLNENVIQSFTTVGLYLVLNIFEHSILQIINNYQNQNGN